MPTVTIPGHGDVEFPDSMSNEQIVAAIKRLPSSTPATAPTGALPSELGGVLSDTDTTGGGEASGAPAALARGMGQGATLGWGDELGAGVEAGLQKILPESLGGIDYGKPVRQLYRENRDVLRRENKEAQDAHPAAFGVGEIAGGLPLGIASAGPKPSIKRLLATGAMLSGSAGAGDSTEDSAGGVAGDAAKAATIGTALTGALLGLGKLAPALAEKLDQAAVNTTRRILRNTGGSLSSKKPLSEAAAREVLDSGVIKPLGTSAGAAERLDVLRENVGDQYGKIVKALETQGITGPDADALAQRYVAEAQARSGNTMNPSVPRAFESAADQLAQKPTNGGRLGLEQAENLKRSLQDKARSAYQKLEPGEVGGAHEDAASMLRQAVEEEIDQQAAASGNPQVQAIASQFEPIKQRAGRLIEASNVARAGQARALNRHAFSLYDVLAGTGAMGHSGNPVEGAAAALAMKLLRERGPSTFARGAYGASKALRFVTEPATTPAQQRTQFLIDALRRTTLPAASEEAGARTVE